MNPVKALHVCCVFCLALAFSAPIIKTNAAVIGGESRTIKKVEKSGAKQDAEILHGDFLFK